ncbi:MAG: hypothetical protein JWM40_1526 [Frankiales bacterium]|nr:hypothetical protein [Frankiales bacterium]
MVHPGHVIIPGRFNGPPDSANGGVTCGVVAASMASPVVEVTLRQPPPLDTFLRLDHNGLYDGERLIAEAGPGEVTVTPPPAVSVDDARAARARFRGSAGHPFPTCFVCGTDRTDGLGLTPGPVTDDVVAVDWTPDSPDPVMVWAALDCPGGWSADLPGRPMVLGRMVCRIDAPPVAGEAHVVQGWLLGSEGRKVLTGSALYSASGQVLAVAQATWITIA